MRRLAVALLVAITACAPKLTPITGVPLPAEKLPRTQLGPGHRRIVFKWEASELTFSSRGDGALRVAAPDSARVDLFLSDGIGAAQAVVIGDSIFTPPGTDAGRLIPPPTLLWAALGRVALPNLADTVIRLDGPVLRADIGRPTAWRLSFHGDSLYRVERVEGGRVREWVDRSDPSQIRYRNEGARRSLQLTITRTDEAVQFDASIWRFDR